MTMIRCSKCNTEFNSKGNAKKAYGTGVVGGMAGGFAGGSLGIAALGTAISGLLPLALLGAGIGYLVRKKFHKCPSCRSDVIV
jgi:hypothetical protein